MDREFIERAIDAAFKAVVGFIPTAKPEDFCCNNNCRQGRDCPLRKGKHNG